MLKSGEIEGITDVVGAITYEEMVDIVKEIAYIREVDGLSEEEIKKMCIQSVSKHFLETISQKELDEDYGLEEEEQEKAGQDRIYYIIGPNAFPDFPFEISEVIDILEITRREVDMDKLVKIFSRRMKSRVTRLKRAIEKCSGDNTDIKKLECMYSNLLNLYYDYDSWLEGRISYMGDEILSLSRQLASLNEVNNI